MLFTVPLLNTVYDFSVEHRLSSPVEYRLTSPGWMFPFSRLNTVYRFPVGHHFSFPGWMLFTVPPLNTVYDFSVEHSLSSAVEYRFPVGHRLSSPVETPFPGWIPFSCFPVEYRLPFPGWTPFSVRGWTFHVSWLNTASRLNTVQRPRLNVSSVPATYIFRLHSDDDSSD
jgi:hypothetical protein